MPQVGIIANPAAGKDVRRLVAHASVFDNNEKVNIIRRVLLGLQAVGVDRVVFMPEYAGLAHKALNGINTALQTSFLDMPTSFDSHDSTLAARMMRELGVSCIVTLGGDGTNRVVAKGCGDVPLMPISTGTNNVFPQMVEGTVAGLAAGVVACGIVAADVATQQRPQLDVLSEDELVDIALIDAVVYDERFLASRAVWDVTRIRQLVLTQAAPHNIGLSAVGGVLDGVALQNGEGLAVETGPGGIRVMAAIAPGLIQQLDIAHYHILQPGECLPVKVAPSVLALDGERERFVGSGENVSIRLNAHGPHVVDVRAALRAAARKGLFVQQGGGDDSQPSVRH